MCGIIACVIASNDINCYNVILNGLKQLQNRGYDSAGICIKSDNEFIISKYASNEKTAIELLDNEKHLYNGDICDIGIGHTRWATHGPKTDLNSHPHVDMTGKIVLVHNGIIENYNEIKTELENHGYSFKTQTDTEVIANMISWFLSRSNNTLKDAFKSSINSTVHMMKGTWALCILHKDIPDTLYVICNGSPILIGIKNDIAIVASESSGFCNHMNECFSLNDNDLCTICKTDKIELTTNNKYTKIPISICNYAETPQPYSHWMLKEIYEQKKYALKALLLGERVLSNKIHLNEMNNFISVAKTIDNIIILACGTCYYAGMIIAAYFKDLTIMNTVMVFDGAEFTSSDIPKNGKTAFIIISQSGETKDLDTCITIGKEHNIFQIGLINKVNSMIARKVDYVCYLNAGREVAVASTKSFINGVIVGSLLAIWFAQIQKTNIDKINQYIRDYNKLALDIHNTIETSLPIIIEWSKRIAKKKSMFVLGKNNTINIAKEGALKIKEIAYIHAEGYSTSSLKHGPFALIEKDFPIIMLDDMTSVPLLETSYEQVSSRGATTYIITCNPNHNFKGCVLVLPGDTIFAHLYMVIPMQLLAFYISREKKLNPDMPRNLAKVVTVF
uniref:glutamine--fructose-6-phosphate transaminase (isomerizing) n=1 Tax=Megaviridae environmental sample TaxID=1737588 RepID=A0A5J6VKJ5_9VIRU|nr:MAG: SIS domain protein [Megaviridae environmental sample]